jgi:hypothetical protein
MLEEAAPASSVDQTPSVDEIIERYVEIIGGDSVFEGHKNYLAKGQLEIAAQGLLAPVELYMEAPNSRKMITRVPGMGEVVHVYDGEHGWEINPMVGPRLLSEDELIVQKHDSRFDAMVNWPSIYTEREVLGSTEFQGATCWTLRLETEEGLERVIHVDQDSGLVVGMEMVIPTDMGDIPVVSRVEDYRKIGNVLMPMRSVQVVGPTEIVVQLESLEWNVPNPPDLSMPDVVRELLPQATPDQ